MVFAATGNGWTTQIIWLGVLTYFVVSGIGTKIAESPIKAAEAELKRLADVVRNVEEVREKQCAAIRAWKDERVAEVRKAQVALDKMDAPPFDSSYPGQAIRQGLEGHRLAFVNRSITPKHVRDGFEEARIKARTSIIVALVDAWARTTEELPTLPRG